MQNIIALIWDFDKTLVDGYMQDPIFEHYNIDAKAFWNEVDELPKKYLKEQNVKVNRDTIYLNHFIKYANDGIFKDLDNDMLKSFGTKLNFYPGIPEIFKDTKDFINTIKGADEYNIKLEHFVVSTGFRQVILGSSVMDFVNDNNVWGCELIDNTDANGNKHISEIAYTIDHTTKTRAIFEINKGVNRTNGLDVNSKMTDEQKRIDFKNMIYIADGPSDIPAFSLIKKMGGGTFAVYPQGNYAAIEQVEKLRSEGRVDYYAEANYVKDSTAYMHLYTRIKNIANHIIEREKSKFSQDNSTPKHLL